MGHLYHRDHLHGLGRAAGFGILTSIIFKVGPGAESFGNIINYVLQRSYSQDREKKADQFGLELVHAIYGKIEGTDRLFKILLENRKLPGWAYMFSTHPSPQQRIIDLEKFADKLMKGNNPKSL